jgi:conjugative transfer signal peptidase TraF
MDGESAREDRTGSGAPPSVRESGIRKHGRRRPLATLCLGAAGVVGLIVAGYAGALRINLTPSYALGLWRIVPLDRDARVGDLVFLCPPRTPAFALAIERGYILRGLCPGWMTPLIKTIAAIPGQHISITTTVRIDGLTIPQSDVRENDAEGRALAPWAGGVVPAGHLFLYSDFAGSYDSRYFGPVPAEGLLGRAEPVLTFGP